MKLVDNHNQKVFVGRNLAIVAAVHLVVFAVAPFYFSTMRALGALAFTMLFAYSMGIFHHMQLTHDSFQSRRWVRRLGATLGTLTWRGPFSGPVMYVAGHRVHHAYSDTELDPHSPREGLFHAFLGWFWRMPLGLTRFDLYRTYAEDIAADPYMVFLDQNVNRLQLLWGLLCFAAGFATGGLHSAIAFTVYFVGVKTFLVWYLANAVDVINHTIGYRGYDTPDDSTNSFLMAAIHGGGAISWHNNHHARPDHFSVRKETWEFDMHHRFLQGLEKLGLVWDIKVLDETTATAPSPGTDGTRTKPLSSQAS